MNHSLERLASEVGEYVDETLIRIGVIYRLFYRAKDSISIDKKQSKKKYSSKKGEKKMQDIIGIRVVLYFADDVEIVKDTLKKKFCFVDETIDISETTEFKPTRINLVFRLNRIHSAEIKDTILPIYPFIDDTYEIQIRTMLSEGWHEVEHDLRYKCPDDWTDHQDLGRTFNGILASLETSDWSTLMIFEKLSHRHYKNSNWGAMLRTKFRLRFLDDKLDNEIILIFNKNPNLVKQFFRINRNSFINEIIKREIKLPFTLSNIVYLCNCIFLGNEKIYERTPQIILENEKLNYKLVM
jgi:ppGpp synthetase/RelA/SpoT-type nucleotidyltranferase